MKKDKLKIILFNIGVSGGAGKAMINLAKAFKEQGDIVYIISFNKSQYPIPKNINFILINSSLKPHLRLKKSLEDIGRFDAIFSNSTPSNKILSKLKIKNSFHIIHSAEIKFYQGVFAPIRSWLRKKKYQKLYSNKNLITVSKDLEKLILEEFKARPKTIKTIYNIVDFDEIKKMSQIIDKNIPKDPFLVHVARYDIASKRQDILLKAYKKANLPYKLFLIGEGKDRERIVRIIKELKLEEKVILTGFISNPYSWIKRAKLLILSSDFEGFGLVLIEALFLNTPVVSTNCKVGPKEILKGNLSDFLVPIRDIEALSNKIKYALNNYPDISKINFDYLDKKVILQEFRKIIEGKKNGI